jgi:hypothetical protein
MKVKLFTLICMICSLGFTGACTKSGAGETQSIPSLSATPKICGNINSPLSQIALATPYALEPAAGICAGPVDGNVATIEIWPDVPMPRCLIVNSGQRLQVSNQTEGEVQIELGPFKKLLPTGGTYTLDCPLGSYLAPGVHNLRASPFSGPEIVLVE